MSVSIKTAQEIELMRESGHLLEKVHDGLIPYIKPGMSTKEIDRIGEGMHSELSELWRLSWLLLHQPE